MLKGLKIENSTVFVKNENSEIWEKVTASIIPHLEDLIKKLDGVTYSKEDKKEDFVFENEVNVGRNTLKKYKDEDGDVVFAYQQNNQKIAPVINEDFDFGIEDNCNIANGEKQFNQWCAKDKSLASSNVMKQEPIASLKNSQFKGHSQLKENESLKSADKVPTKHLTPNKSVKKVNEVQITPKMQISKQLDSIGNKISGLKMENSFTTLKIIGPCSEDILKKLSKKPIIKKPVLCNKPIRPKIIKLVTEPLNYRIKKRMAKSTFTNGVQALQIMLRSLKTIEDSDNGEDFTKNFIVPLNKDSFRPVSFIKRVNWSNKVRKNGEFFKLAERHRRNNNLMDDQVALLFKLENDTIKEYDDVEFDNLMDETVNANIE